MRSLRRPFFCWLLALLAGALPAIGSASEKPVCVLLSREIAPYVAMVEGLENAFGNQPLQRFFLGRHGEPYSLAGPGGLFDPQGFSALVAVGPEALRYLQSQDRGAPLVFGMVLNPNELISSSYRPWCGVSLNIPAAAQFSSIRRHLPRLKRLGVLFDPENNQDWFDDASPAAALLGLTLVPLRVARAAERLSFPGDFSGAEALLFIPDRSIISQAIIQHVIKEAARRRLPVVGYNQFFHDAGAALSFIIDYRAVGVQVAGQLERLLAGGSCKGETPPEFTIQINRSVWRALRLGGEG